jgi:hypothetical protein
VERVSHPPFLISNDNSGGLARRLGQGGRQVLVDEKARRRHAPRCLPCPIATALFRQSGAFGLPRLTDAEWAILCPFVPPQAKCGRKRAYPMREVVNAICYVLRGGIA